MEVSILLYRSKVGLQGVSKNRNTFDLKYLKDGSIKLVVLLKYYSVMSYNSIELKFSFLCLELGLSKLIKFENNAQINFLLTIYKSLLFKIRSKFISKIQQRLK